MDDFITIFSYFEKGLTALDRQLVTEIYPMIKPIIENFSKPIIESTIYSPAHVNDKSSSTSRSDYNSVPLCNTDNDNADRSTILSYKEKIDGIVKLLDTSHEKQEVFLENFPNWEKQRQTNIENLRKIAESMQNVRKASNIVKITAGSVGVIGGAAIIGSILFPPAAPALLPSWLGGAAASALLPSIFLPAAPAVSSLAIAGGVAAAGGAVGTAGASITEKVLTQNSLDKTKIIIEEDGKLLKKLGVFEFFDEFNFAIDSLFGKSVASEILDDFVAFLKEIPPILKKIEFIQRQLRFCLESILPCIPDLLAVGIPLASVILAIFFVIFITRCRGCAILKHRLTLGLVSAVDAGVEVTRLIAAAGLEGSKLAELIPRQLAGKITVGVIAGVGIGLDIANIVVSSIDLAEGSFSEEISLTLEVANQLESRLKSYQEVNDKLQKFVNQKLKITDVLHWTAVIVNHVPQYASRQDITNAFNQYLPNEAMGCIQLEKLPTDGNHWVVKVPTSHSHVLLRQSNISIVGNVCLIMQ